MSEIYENMAKLFETFTKGALLEQGANSELVLRTVYRSLNEDFLKIVQDTSAVDKLIEAIKEKQGQVEENPETIYASNTTKEVASGKFDPDNCNLMQVVLDFVDELQTAILQVRLNLNREYEYKKLQMAKSFEGQQEDIDNLT